MKTSMIKYNFSNAAGLQVGLQPEVSLKVDSTTIIFLVFVERFQNIHAIMNNHYIDRDLSIDTPFVFK